MKNLLFLIALVTSCVSLYAQEPNLWQNNDGEFIETIKPILLFEKEMHDFGELIEGDKYEYVFNVKNLGSTPLILQNVKASCGCTTPEWTKEPVMPNESTDIKVIYNTKNRMGAFNKAITITSNAIEPTKRLYIKGTVIKGEIEEIEKVVPAVEQKELILEEKKEDK